jgi:hypothetical protein
MRLVKRDNRGVWIRYTLPDGRRTMIRVGKMDKNGMVFMNVDKLKMLHVINEDA